MRKKIVFILGMHRSGTSLTAELVHSMGFSLPGTSLDSIDSVNAHGFWESKEVFDINEKILAAAGLRWFHICPVGHVFQNLAEKDVFLREISHFLKAESEKYGDLVIKDPRLCLLWPLWLAAVDHDVFDVRFIFVNRHPSSIAASIRKRDGFSFFSSHLLWLYYFFSVFGGSSLPEVLVLNYEDLLEDTDYGEKIASFIGASKLSEECWGRVVEPLLQRNVDRNFPSEGFIFSVENSIFDLVSHGNVYSNFDFLDEQNRLFDRYIFESSDLVFALNESNNCIVESRSDLVFIGSMHSEALNVIKEKDFSIFESSAYIESCHSRISELDRRVADLSELLDECDKLSGENKVLNAGIERNALYISECEGRIFDLEFSMSDFLALRERLKQFELVILEKDSDARQNESYISKVHERIRELEGAMIDFVALRNRISDIENELKNKENEIIDNTNYIKKCHERISELDDIFLQQRGNYLSCLNSVKQVESRLANRNEEFLSIMDECSVLKNRLDKLLSFGVVRMLERYSYKGAD